MRARVAIVMTLVACGGLALVAWRANATQLGTTSPGLGREADRYARSTFGVDAGPLFFIATRAEAGAGLDVRAMRAEVERRERSRSVISKLGAWLLPEAHPADPPVHIRVDAARARSLVTRLALEVNRDAVAARVTGGGRLAAHAEPGWQLDADASLRALLAGLTANALVVDLVGHETHAPIDPNVLLPYAPSTELLAEQTTRYSRGGDDAPRAHNVELAASLLDGATIAAGDELSFNAQVGPRTESAGFRMAHVIEDGEMVDGIGGGTCQVASTFHAAAFFAGLDILEHHPHSRPSAYIAMGLDATVVYPGVDLRVRNPLPFRVTVRASAVHGRLTVTLFGAARLRNVTWTRRVLERYEFSDRMIDDPAVPVGQSIISQDGIEGFLVRRVRTVTTEAGSFEQVAMLRYPPTPRIVRVAVK